MVSSTGGTRMIDDRLMKIANHYGLAHQKGKLVEEMAELTKDIMKGVQDQATA